MDEVADTAGGLRLCRPADPTELRTIRHRVSSWAHRHRLPPDVLTDLQLAVGEAVANGVEHAYRDGPPGSVDVELALQPDRDGRSASVAVLVADHGRWRSAPLRSGHRGRGLTLIGRVAERVRVSVTRAGTEVRFEIPIPGGDSRGGICHPIG